MARRKGHDRPGGLPRPSSTWGPVRSKPRVLLEQRDPARGWVEESVLLAQGYDVAVCWGPSSGRTPCPLVSEGDCALVDGADAIVFALGVHDPDKRRILETILERQHDPRVAVELPQPREAEFPDLLSRCERLRFPSTSERLVEVVARLVEKARAGTSAQEPLQHAEAPDP